MQKSAPKPLPTAERPITAGAQKHVFLNFPFDRSYERLYLALIAGIAALDLNPRCVLELDTTADRLNRLLSLISGCDYSIHDMSRVQLDSVPPRCPRFNMPFELGLTIALASRSTHKHKWVVLEEMPFRLQKSLSDLNGYDHHIHSGTVTGMLQVLNDVFQSRDRRVSLSRMKSAYRSLRRYSSALREENEWDSLYRPDAFHRLVLAARDISMTL